MDVLIEEMDESLWVACVQKNKLQGLEIDPLREEVRWGSIYWGKVTRIDKALDAVFVNLDGDNQGILYNADIRVKDTKGKVTKGGAKSIGTYLKTGQMIAVQSKSGYMPKQESIEIDSEDKLPKLSMDITLPGRFLIYSPLMTDNRISSRIKDKTLRGQLKKMLDSIDKMEGCILRAAAAYTQTDILIREGKILNSIWEQLQDHFKGEEQGLIMRGPNAIQRTLSDHADKTIDHIEVVTMDRYEQAEEWCEIYAPDLVTKVTPVELENPYADLALFDYRDIIDQVEDLFQPYAILESGANIIIQKTAALTAIDINRGGDKRGNLDINLDVAAEIGRQLRLRNLGGLIVLDLLKMKNKTEQNKVLKALEESFAQDPCTVQIHDVTALGLVEITRKRRTPALEDRLDGAF